MFLDPVYLSVRNTFGFPASLSPHKVSSDIAMVDMVADTEVDMVADMVADNKKTG